MPFSKFTKEFRHQTIFFSCSTYFYTYCIIRWWYIHVLSHSFHFKFLHISNCFEVMLDGFITTVASAFNFRKYWTWTTRNYGEHFSIWKEIMLLDATKWPRSDVDTSWWKRDKIFWWDKRNWWLQFSKVELVLPVISPAVWFAVAFFW